MQEDNRRRFPRLSLRFPVYIKKRSDQAGKSEERAETVNVSSGGVMVQTGRNLGVGERVDVSITVPYTVWNRFPTVKVEAGAEVLRVKALPSPVKHRQKKFETVLKFDEPLRTIVW